MDEKMDKEALQESVGVDEERLREFTRVLLKYKAGKQSVERRAIDAESWWKLRNQIQRERDTAGISGFNAKSGWLHNTIVAKHADLLEAFPEPNILPRAADDKAEAGMLSKIVPVILEQNDFGDVYSDVMWQKLKTGTGIYKVYWDAQKLNGLGDIAIDKIDILNVFWEPGVSNIQDSKYFFHTCLMDNEILEGMYPQLKGKLKNNAAFVPAKFQYDDTVSNDGKSCVIDVYYKQKQDNKTVLQYCKYVGNEIIYATENIQQQIAQQQAQQMAQEPPMMQQQPGPGMQQGMPPAGPEEQPEQTGMMPSMPQQQPAPKQPSMGLYDHGLYPFVFDTMYPVEGSPSGYGFIDLCANGQEQLDMMQTAFIRNTMAGAMPRYFERAEGSVNEEEFLNLSNPIVHVNGNLGDDSLRLIEYKGLDGNYINMRQYTIDEMRQTSGNTETSNGNTPSGVTAASAIAALQEAAGKGSRDATRTTYRAYSKVVELVIELIRQFYDLPRQFRITGTMGMDQFVEFDNSGIMLQQLGMAGGMQMYRLPEFDIKVDPAKRTAYSRVAQNELALQFYNLGFFAPQQVDQALSALQMMDFDSKDDVAQMIARNGTMYQKLALFQQFALAMAQKYEPERVPELAAAITGQQPQVAGGSEESAEINTGTAEDTRVTKARERSREASQV